MIYHFNIIILLFSCFLIACRHAPKADDLALDHGFKKQLVNTEDFAITTYQKILTNDKDYVFYIEGDGRVLLKGKSISIDPTPKNNTLFSLACLDKRPNVVYVSRPCQYTPKELNLKCYNNKYWTNARYSKEIVDSMRSAINQIAGNNNYSLVGYSGGGAIAMLVSIANPKVKDITTIAGNLDIHEFQKYHKVNYTMSESLNPIDYINFTKHIKQLHLSGAKDKIVPTLIAKKFTEASASGMVNLKIIPNASHKDGWQEIWPAILNTASL